MATFTTFEDIEAWKKAHRISLEIYRITNDSLLSRDYSLKPLPAILPKDLIVKV
jgi:hypothetical protein